MDEIAEVKAITRGVTSSLMASKPPLVAASPHSILYNRHTPKYCTIPVTRVEGTRGLHPRGAAHTAVL